MTNWWKLTGLIGVADGRLLLHKSDGKMFCGSFRQLWIQISADNGVFGQTGPKVGSFDAGYGSTQMVRLIGQKKAREMWFLARLYSAQEALAMGLVNKVLSLNTCSCISPRTTVDSCLGHSCASSISEGKGESV
jgi:hypothetical protein